MMPSEEPKKPESVADMLMQELQLMGCTSSPISDADEGDHGSAVSDEAEEGGAEEEADRDHGDGQQDNAEEEGEGERGAQAEG